MVGSYKKYLISIVIPIYNIEEYIEECILSTIKQTYENIEIILVNDGSTDGSLKICEKYVHIDSRISLINKPNGGLISARKAGVKIAKGEYIAYIDGDDFVKPKMFETLIEQASDTSLDLIVGGHIEKWTNHEEVVLNYSDQGVYEINDRENNIINTMIFNGKFSQPGIFSYVWGKLFKSDLLIKWQLSVDEKMFIGEDAACLYPYILDCRKIKIINDSNYYYRQRPGSMIKTPDKNETIKILHFYDYLRSIFNNHLNKNSLINQLNYFTLSLLTVRSDFLPENIRFENIYYPFENVRKKDRIILCGAGTFGQIIYSKIVNVRKHDLVCWVDPLHKEYENMNLNVEPFGVIKQKKFDKILIAYIDEEVSSEMKNKIVSMGIKENKISSVIYHRKKDINDILNVLIKTAE